MQLKLTWEEFVQAAINDICIKQQVDIYDLDDGEKPTFVINRTEGEGEICETPDSVYLNLKTN